MAHSSPVIAYLMTSIVFLFINQVNGGYHLIAPGEDWDGDANWAGYGDDTITLCTEDSSIVSAVTGPTAYHGFNIRATCCTMDGSSGARPGCSSSNTAPGVTYAEAEQICADNGYRLCTVEEIGSMQISGCNYDWAYNWVSDSCGANVDPITDCGGSECNDFEVCEDSTGECIRDCDVLHIDEFLLDCSTEWDTNTANVATMTSSIATNAADIVTLTATVNSEDADVTALKTRMDAVESKLDDIQLVLDKMGVFDAGAHTAIGNVDSETFTDLGGDNSWSMTFDTKDLVMVTLLMINVFLIITMTIIYRTKHRVSPKYQSVSISSD